MYWYLLMIGTLGLAVLLCSQDYASTGGGTSKPARNGVSTVSAPTPLKNFQEDFLPIKIIGRNKIASLLGMLQGALKIDSTVISSSDAHLDHDDMYQFHISTKEEHQDLNLSISNVGTASMITKMKHLAALRKASTFQTVHSSAEDTTNIFKQDGPVEDHYMESGLLTPAELTRSEDDPGADGIKERTRDTFDDQLIVSSRVSYYMPLFL